MKTMQQIVDYKTSAKYCYWENKKNRRRTIYTENKVC